jgi:hypothetical protein
MINFRHLNVVVNADFMFDLWSWAMRIAWNLRYFVLLSMIMFVLIRFYSQACEFVGLRLFPLTELSLF